MVFIEKWWPNVNGAQDQCSFHLIVLYFVLTFSFLPMYFLFVYVLLVQTCEYTDAIIMTTSTQ